MCSYCRKPDHTEIISRFRLNDEKFKRKEKEQILDNEFQSYFSEDYPDEGSTNWYVDSGATNHMTNKIHVFKTFQSLTPESITVKVIGMTTF